MIGATLIHFLAIRIIYHTQNEFLISEHTYHYLKLSDEIICLVVKIETLKPIITNLSKLTRSE